VSTYDGDSTDLTTSKYIYPSYSSNQSVTGHTDSYGDIDYGYVYLSSSGYYDLTTTGNTSAYIYDATSGNYLYGYSSSGGSYLYSNHTNYVYVTGYTSGQTYTVTVKPDAASHSYDGDSTDLTTSSGYLYPSYSSYQTVYGHTDSYGDLDYGYVYLSSSGYYDLTVTGNTSAYIYDATTGTAYYGSSSSGGSYLNSGHSNYVYVTGYTTGQTYTVTVKPDTTSHTYDGDSTDLTTTSYIYPSYSGYQSATGHTDSYGDADYGYVYLSSSGYYDLTATGNTSAYIYDSTTGTAYYGSSSSGGSYLTAGHSNYVYVTGYTTGQTYTVTVKPDATSHITDGDYTDLTTGKYIYPEYSGYQSATGHTDYSGDIDYGSLYLSSSGYFNLTTTGDTSAYIYDATTGTALNGSSYNSGVYVNSGHSNYVYVSGYTTGQTYTVTVKPDTTVHVADGDSTDLTTSKYICPEYTAYQSATGHSDSSGDWDYGSIWLNSSGYYDVTTTGSTAAAVYDKTTGAYLYGSSYQSGLYLDATHINNVAVVGFASGESYTVTVKPSTAAHDGDSTDLTTSKYICPEFSGYQTATGHTDSSGDWDYGSIWLNSSGYYDVTTTGSTAACIYDKTTGSYLYGSSYQSNLYLDATHINNVAVVGFATGESYSVTIKPHS